jgi:hypothetical protein
MSLKRMPGFGKSGTSAIKDLAYARCSFFDILPFLDLACTSSYETLMTTWPRSLPKYQIKLLLLEQGQNPMQYQGKSVGS